MGFNVDLLHKDELLYELQWRGFPVTVNNTVTILRKQLRKALKENVPTKWENLTVLRVTIELDNCREKVEEFRELLASVEEIKEAVGIHRLKERVSHLRRRLGNLLENGNIRLPDQSRNQVSEWVNESNQWEKLLCKGLDRLDQTVVEASLRKLSETHEVEENGIESDSIDYSKDVFEPENAQAMSTLNRNQTGNNVSGSSVEISNLGIDKRLHTSSISDLFTKLTNPLEKIIREIPSNVNGLDHNKLLALLNVVNKLKKCGKLNDSQVLEVVASHVSEPLLGRINTHIQCGSNVSTVHSALLRYFIPQGLYEKLKRDLVHRPQGPDEPLAMYVCEVRNNAELLKCDYSERELIDVIIVGINPRDRNKLVFQEFPKSLQDLEKMCMVIKNVEYNDWEREQIRGRRNQFGGNSSGRGYVNNVNTTNGREGGSNQMGPRLCHYCSKPGHFIRDCWRRGRDIRGGHTRGGHTSGVSNREDVGSRPTTGTNNQGN